jgi:predicted MPP superfamily phosphohydrolase
LHLAVYGTFAMAFGITNIVFGCFFVVLTPTFLTASFLTYWFKGKVIDWYYIASAYWFGLINFLFIGAAIFYFTLNIAYSHTIYIAPALVGTIAFGVVFLIHLYGTWLSGWAEITRISVPLPGLPAPWKNKKMVFVSDVHLGNIRQQGFAKKVVRRIMAEKSDLVVIGGDLYDGVACDVPGLIQPLRDLKAPLGVYYVTGNHEYIYRNVAELIAAIKALGIRILDNEVVEIAGLTFLGVDNHTTMKRDDFQRVLDATRGARKNPTVLIMHEPNHLDATRDAGIAAAFYGHTHRGQIFPLTYITRKMYKGFDYGLKQLGKLQIYTSSGVGTWGPPLRLGTKSEIVVVQFLSEKEN